ncbi:hypothetical protein GQ457_15G016890 [Hibiscus cannabinus]
MRKEDNLECKQGKIYLFDIGRVKLTKRVNTVHVRDQKHEITPPRNRYLYDNGIKKVTAFPSRDIVHKQDKQTCCLHQGIPIVILSRQIVEAVHYKDRRNCNRLPHYDTT